MQLPIRRMILGVLVTSQLLTGCTSWQVVQVSPRALVDSAHASVIRVQEAGGTPYVLHALRLSGDSLIGTVDHRPISGPVIHTVRGVPLAAVHQVAIRKFDTGRTLLGVLGLPVFAIITFILYCGATQCPVS